MSEDAVTVGEFSEDRFAEAQKAAQLAGRALNAGPAAAALSQTTPLRPRRGRARSADAASHDDHDAGPVRIDLDACDHPPA
jgi:hypothetical protein